MTLLPSGMKVHLALGYTDILSPRPQRNMSSDQ